MKYYHCSETDRIVSEERLRSEWEQGKAEGWIVPDETGYDSFTDYLECCMYYNNGTLTPVRTYIEELRNRLRYELDSYERESIENEITIMTKLESEV